MANASAGRLLVVEDKKFYRVLLGRYLEEQGHTIAFAENGRQALEMLRAQPFDMILLDIEMPEMNGYQVLDEIMIDPQLRDIPVIVTSALEEMDSVVKCIEMGAEDYLMKPVNRVLLKARIDASLEKKRLRDQQRETLRRLENEMEIARQTQESILPDQLPRQNGYDFGALMIPASRVGGDFYDIFALGSKKLGVVIGDVCDKGLPAALFMALTYGLVRAEASRMDRPGQTLLKVNRFLLKMNASCTYVTLLYGILDYTTGEFLYARASHPLPAILDKGGQRVEVHDQPSQPLGLFDDPPIDEQNLTIPIDGMALLFSDGLSEAADAQGNEFGKDGIDRVCFSQRFESAQEICHQLWQAVNNHICGSLQQDDFTVLVIKRIVH
jgi:phosphoserine phosphatase RsbU/P